VRILDGQLDFYVRAMLERLAGVFDQAVVERLFEAVVLAMRQRRPTRLGAGGL